MTDKTEEAIRQARRAILKATDGNAVLDASKLQALVDAAQDGVWPTIDRAEALERIKQNEDKLMADLLTFGQCVTQGGKHVPLEDVYEVAGQKRQAVDVEALEEEICAQIEKDYPKNHPAVTSGALIAIRRLASLGLITQPEPTVDRAEALEWVNDREHLARLNIAGQGREPNDREEKHFGILNTIRAALSAPKPPQ